MYGYEDADNRNHDETWHMTGNTGTPRYMSPEVALEQPYNASCDTYSFCILLWEMLALRTPFDSYTMKAFRSKVWSDKVRKRPIVDPSWSKELQSLFEYGWCQEIQHRTPMSGVSRILRQEVISCRPDGNTTGIDLEHKRRRSTHVLEISPSQKNLLSKILASPFSAKKSPFRLSKGLSNRSLGGRKDTSKRDILASDDAKESKPTSQSSLRASPTSRRSSRHLGGRDGGDGEGRSSKSQKSIPMLPSKPPLLDDDDLLNGHEGNAEKAEVTSKKKKEVDEGQQRVAKLDVGRRTSEKRRSASHYSEDDSVDNDEAFNRPRSIKTMWSEKLDLEKARQQRIRDRIAKIQSSQQ